MATSYSFTGWTPGKCRSQEATLHRKIVAVLAKCNETTAPFIAELNALQAHMRTAGIGRTGPTGNGGAGRSRPGRKAVAHA